MSLTALLRSLRPGSVCRRPVPRSFVPGLTALEDRTLPSPLPVTSAAAGGPGSLPAGLGAAADGDTIRFDNSLKGQTISLTGGQLNVTRSVTIAGLGQDKLTVSGGNASRVFAVSAGAAVTIDSLTITNGKAAAGGG